jgi:hypothetical protein
MGVSKDNVQAVADKLDTLHSTTTKTAGGLDKAKESSVNLGQSMLQTGRIVQDFAQGGLGGILNNVEGFAAALGLGSGVAGLVTAVGVAAYIALPHVKNFINGLVDGANKIPKSTDQVAEFTDAIKANAKELEALKDKQILTNTELARYNELTAKQVGLEKSLADATKQRKREQEFDAVRPAGAEKKENEQAEALKNLVGNPAGRQQEMVQETGRALAERKQRQREAEFNAMPGRDKMTRAQLDRHSELTRQMGQYQRGEMAGSEDANAKAELARAVGGDPEALERLMGVLPKDSTTREILRQGSPEELAGNRQERRDTDRQQKQAEAQQKRRKEVERRDKQRTDADVADSERAEAEHEKATKKDQDDIAADVAKRGHENLHRVNETDIDERAASRAGVMRAQGGVYDEARDQIHRMTPRQQEAWNQRQAEREIGQRFPSMPQGERQAAARQTTQGATGQVNEQLQQATVSALNAGLNATQATQAAMQQTLQRLQAAEERANMLTKNAGAMNQQNQPASNAGRF